jgi:hypothetical protein
MVLGPISFMVGRRTSLFSKISSQPGPLCMVIPATNTPWLWAYLK